MKKEGRLKRAWKSLSTVQKVGVVLMIMQFIAMTQDPLIMVRSWIWGGWAALLGSSIFLIVGLILVLAGGRKE